MGRFDDFIICCDYDGTLTMNKGVKVTSALKQGVWNICEENIAAVKYFAENGGRFIMASGRSPARMSFLYDYLPLDDLFAGINGTILFSKSQNKVIYEHRMRLDFEWFVRDVFSAIPEIPEYHVVTTDMTVHLWTKDEGDPMEFLSNITPKSSLKVIFDSRDDLLLMEKIEGYVRANYSDRLEISKSCPHFLECNDKGSGKGDVVKLLKRENPQKTVIALGDYGNDESMFIVADYAYCPDNATPEIKALANKVFRESGDGFIADVVLEIENNLCKK